MEVRKERNIYTKKNQKNNLYAKVSAPITKYAYFAEFSGSKHVQERNFSADSQRTDTLYLITLKNNNGKTAGVTVWGVQKF